MKVVADYLKRAVEFEAHAAREKNPWFKVDLARQAAAYRKLAEKSAEQYGSPNLPESMTHERPSVAISLATRELRNFAPIDLHARTAGSARIIPRDR